jgi:hypothetical protein
MRPNGLELCCPAAQAWLPNSRATLRASGHCVCARQPGQHQRVVGHPHALPAQVELKLPWPSHEEGSFDHRLRLFFT